MTVTRVLLISHTCQSRTEGQPKAEILARMSDIDIKVILPHRWRHYGIWRNADVDVRSKIFDVCKVRWPWLGPAQFYLHWYPSLKKILETFRPDIIDLWEEPWGLVSAHAVSLRNRYFKNTKIVSETEQNISRHLPPPFEQFRKYTLRHADFLVGRSREAVQVARAKGFNGPACTVPNAVDTALFRPLDRRQCREELGWNPNMFIAGYVGRLVERKGLVDLVSAVKLCAPQIAVAFIGAGPMHTWLQEQALLPALAGRVLCVPSRPLNELASVMNALDVLVLPSRTVSSWKEQFGRVIIEANACGVPVIGSDSGAIPEVVEQSGIVYSEGNVRELAEAITRMQQNPDLCRRAGAAGLAQVELKYTWDRVAERMAEIYRHVVAR